MVGLRQLRTNPVARLFAESLLEQAADKCQSPPSAEFGLGRHPISLSWSRHDEVSALATEAFLSRPVRVEVERTQVFVVRLSGDGIVIPNFEWAREWIEKCAPIPTVITSPYRVFIDRNQGVIYCYDPVRNQAAIILRTLEEIDVRSLITPFRLMWAWIGSSKKVSIIHGGVVSLGGRGILLAGPSGSGKSTLSFGVAALGAGKFLADDCVVVEQTRAHALYARAKVENKDEQTYGQFDFRHVPGHLREARQAKSFVRISGTEPWFCSEVDLVAIAFPAIAGKTGHYRIDSARAQRLLTEDSTRELFGGTPHDTIRMAKLARLIPAHRLLLGDDRAKNIKLLESLLEP